MPDFLLVLLAYMIGSVSTAVLVSKRFYGIDIREHGSGNAGATNTFRVLGKNAGVIVMAADILKGFLAVKLSLLSQYSWHPTPSVQFVNLQVILGIASVLGHIFPIWSGFRGGKGIATLFGMILGIQPLVAVSLVGVFLLMLLATRYVSLSSISASIAFPLLILFIFREPELSYKIFAIGTAFLVVLTHHKNIGRLLNGNESKVPIFKKRKMRRDKEEA
ncbi:glycerol-3-phosphate 1-O-acyltransferase PlsY [Rurimicrobium arvi]|uniref:Glycerol-3-phosphate acyltransferase n=1 Tax=Rurimicrobium arvi TaxID=2049916 RepID=A0ABP8MWV0_9BACT